jgi:predicted permease
MNEFFRRLRYLLQRRRLDQELAADLEFHREMAAREGRLFGNALLLREEAREAWGWTWIDRFFQDLHYAFRQVRKSPGFTAAAILMLAIGIGVNVAAFGFFNLVFLRPLPVRDPDTLLRFQRRAPQSFSSDLPYPEVAFFRENSRTLSAILASQEVKLTVDDEAKPLRAQFVTANFFSELGAAAIVGRTFDAARDDAVDAEPVVVLGHGFWQRHFGADPWVVGRPIRLNGKPATVIGVLPSEFSGLGYDAPDVWLPLNRQPDIIQGSRLLTDYSAARGGVLVWGRLQNGMTPQMAEGELRSLAAELRKQRPADIWEDEDFPSSPGGYIQSSGGGYRGTMQPPGLRQSMAPVLALMSALVLLILGVACGNLGSLLLARSISREREISIRTAVGAGSGRLIRQLFTESLVLALLGSAAGLGLGYVVLRVLLAFAEAPAWLDASPDWRVVAFAVGAGLLSAILFGLTPALQVARQRHRTTSLRQVLVGAQVAGSCVLLILAGLLVRALDHVMSTHPGFEYQNVLSIDPDLSAHGYSAAQSRTYLDALASRLRGVPGIESVSLTCTSPLGRKNVIGANIEVGGQALEISVNRVDAEFLGTMKIPILRGRGLARGDGPRTVVVSESLARRVWPNEDPVGKLLPMGEDPAGSPVRFEVVGVAGNARMTTLEDPDKVEMYQLPEAAELPSMVALARTSGPAESMVAVVASISRAIDASLLPEVGTLKNAFRLRVQSTERSALAVSVLGIAALLLACLGIIGVVAYGVSQRAKEIGIRMALGAKPSHILSVVLRQFSRPVAAGLLVGAGGAAALSQILRRQLYGVGNLDPITYLSAIGIFAIAAAFAAMLPARRALRVDPVRALRSE